MFFESHALGLKQANLMPGRVNKMFKAYLFNFSEHISANTPKLNAYRL